MKKLPSLKFLLLSLCLAVGFVCLSSFDIKAQTCTSQNSPPVNKAGWVKGSNVQVYIDPAIVGDQRNAVVQAFTNWGGVGTATNSSVSYTIVNSPPPAGSNSFTVRSTAPVDNPGTRAETTTSYDQFGHTIGAETRLDPHVTNAAAVLEVMAHEIGHPAGFGECTSCAPADSVMGPGPAQGDYNAVVGRPTSPSACDTQQLQKSDYPYCSTPIDASCQIWDANTCTCSQYAPGGGGGGGGAPEEGGGGGYYYCTPYYWCYYTSYDGGDTWQLDEVDYAGCW
jgi:hypothetical protein